MLLFVFVFFEEKVCLFVLFCCFIFHTRCCSSFFSCLAPSASPVLPPSLINPVRNVHSWQFKNILEMVCGGRDESELLTHVETHWFAVNPVRFYWPELTDDLIRCVPL